MLPLIRKEGSKQEVKSARPLVKDTNLGDSLSEHVANYFLEKIYTKEFRHGTLHGRRIDYNTEENSTNLLLFLKVLLDTCQ